jgi:hypothetical protein
MQQFRQTFDQRTTRPKAPRASTFPDKHTYTHTHAHSLCQRTKGHLMHAINDETQTTASLSHALTPSLPLSLSLSLSRALHSPLSFWPFSLLTDRQVTSGGCMVEKAFNAVLMKNAKRAQEQYLGLLKRSAQDDDPRPRGDRALSLATLYNIHTHICKCLSFSVANYTK